MEGRKHHMEQTEGYKRLLHSSTGGEYAVENRVSEEPVFVWWVKFLLRKRDCIISKTQRHWLKSHKYGIRVPNTIEEAILIDKENGDIPGD